MTTPIPRTPPLQLLRVIFALACTDTGQTGRALGASCRIFREICLDTGVDIQHVAVHGLPSKMETFLHMLYNREQSKRRVLSMFLTYREGDGWSEEEQILPSQRGKCFKVS